MATADAQRYCRIAQADLQEARRMVELLAGGVAPFTHDLAALIDLLKHLGVDANGFAELTDLTFFAVQSRYDDELEIDEPDWPEFIERVESLLLEVERRLPRA